MGLTAHQQLKMADLIQLILTGHKRIVLKGSAGTGKTFLTSELIKVLKTTLYQYGAVYVTAPTHKALAVLKTKIEEKPYIHFQTIHSALSLKAIRDFKTGRQTFIQKINPRFPPFRAAQVVLLDEASMVGWELQKYIDGYPDLLFIYIGDHKQLNPVGEIDSAPFLGQPIAWNMITNKDGNTVPGKPIEWIPYPSVELTEIIRQGAGNPIIELSRNLNQITSKKDNLINSLGYVFDNNRTYITDKLAEVNGTDDLKYIAWSNNDTNLINADVRKRIYGIPKKIELGESIVLNAPHRRYKNNEEVKINSIEVITKVFGIPSADSMYTAEGLLVSKRSNGTVETVSLKVYSVNNDLPDFTIPDPEAEDSDEEESVSKGEIIILHEDSHNQMTKLIKTLKDRVAAGDIIWPYYYQFIEQFADYTYNHAITCHKSQGSTFQTTIMNVGNMLFNKNKPELEKLLYTGVTRAAKTLVLYNVK